VVVTFPLPEPPFIVVEGLDGAGTTTQTERVAQMLRDRGQPAATSCEPSQGPVGTLIRQMLSMRITVPDGKGGHRPVGRETLALLFAADRLDHLESHIEPTLGAGKAAISDRYYHSSFVYQGEGEGEHVDYEWVRTLNERARRPDLTVFLEAPVDLCLQRMAHRANRDIFESRASLKRLHRRYQQVMDLLVAQGENILRLDAALPKEELTEAIVDAVAELA
jgi:dTMP kinase